MKNNIDSNLFVSINDIKFATFKFKYYNPSMKLMDNIMQKGVNYAKIIFVKKINLN